MRLRTKTGLLMKNLWLLLLGTGLIGCGSGGGDSSAPAPTPVVTSKVVQVTVNGTGQVKLSDGQVCQQSCNLTVNNSNIELTPVAAEASQFDSWQQDCSGTGSCRLDLTTLSTAKVVASFVPRHVSLRLTSQPGGSIDYTAGTLAGSCTNACSITAPYGATVVLQAKASTYSDFTGWQNICSATATSPRCEFVAKEETNIVAKFATQQVELRILVSGPGEVSSAALSTPCRTDCTYKVNAGAQVELKASADAGQRFSGFSEPCVATTPCTVTMDTKRTVTAGFVADEPPADGNFIILTNPTDQKLTNYPLQFARPFVAGEIAQAPQLKLSEQLLPTQADIKQRYPDGSVRHAIISVLIPEIAANSTLRLQLVNQAVSANQTGLSQAQMLADAFDFDAQIKAVFADNQTQQRSARELLSKGKFSYWVQGPIATTVLIADHSEERSGDFGADAHRSVRPLFYATFWPVLNKVQVRFVGEVSNTEALQDQSYDLTLLGGAKAPQVLYQQAELPHLAMTRWTRQFWLGAQVPVVSLNHQLGYLSKTRLLPNFDLKRKVPETTMATQFSNWQKAAKDLYNIGFWQKAMPAAGGRQDLGLYPSWTVRWLYTGDWRMAEIALRQAELSGAWPIHLREGGSGRTFDEARQVSGLGRILSINPGGRPTLWFRSDRLSWPETDAGDRIQSISKLASNSWVPDVAHHPDLASAQYLLSGDYYFLEQSWFSAAYTTMNNNAGAAGSTLGRGPTGSEGALYSGEARAQGWALRSRVHAASVSPDDSPERAYLELLTVKALEIWEGLYDVANPAAKYPELRSFARSKIGPKEFPYAAGAPSPLGQWGHSDQKATNFSDGYYDYSKAAGGASPWMAHLVILALGRAEELGYPAGPMKGFVGRMLTGPATTEGFPLELLSAYRQPSIRQPDGLWFTNWLQVQDAYLTTYRAEEIARYATGATIDAEFGYNAIVLATSAYLTDLPGGPELQKFYSERWGNLVELDRSPKWALKPR